MTKYRSKAGVEIKAELAIEPLEIRRDDCVDSIRAGDAVLTLDGATYGMRAELFRALFEESKPEPAAKPPKKA